MLGREEQAKTNKYRDELRQMQLLLREQRQT